MADAHAASPEATTTAARRQASGISRLLPRGWRDFLLQLGLFVVIDLLYEFTRTLADSNVQTAFQHARNVVHLERAVGIFNELDVQHWVLHRSWATSIADYTYFYSYFTVTVVFMLWMYLRRNDYYYFVRNAVFVADGIALLGFALYPTAPPRMLSDLGFVDLLERTATLNHGSFAALANPFAAVPSVHTCYATLTGVVCFLLVSRRPLKLLFLLYPLLIVFAIVATGNHFWFDAITGATAALTALSAAWLIERWHPTLPPSARRRLRLQRSTGIAPVI
ncbi:MAG TPA: phosphatase PAP2 family protein [Gaiellales bacterium]|nr:phosphatase PAP2 family protein [Gaiellales bacterium]